MAIYILDKESASAFIPERRTKAIRIFNSNSGITYPDLQHHPNFTSVHEYCFDEIDPGDWPVEVLCTKAFRNSIIFDEDIASRILDDFERSDGEDLLVHCNAGMMRSPAVAIALNEIYGLGADTETLKTQHPHYMTHVYEVMLKAAKGRKS